MYADIGTCAIYGVHCKVTPWFVETAGNSMWESFVYGFTPRWPEWAVKVANLGMPKVLHNIRAAGAEEQEHAVDL